MHRNTSVLYNNVNEVYTKLIKFMPTKGFKIEESNEKFYHIKARKRSILFWRTLRLELEILAVEKEQVQITVLLYRLGKRQLKLENEYVGLMETYLNRESGI